MAEGKPTVGEDTMNSKQLEEKFVTRRECTLKDETMSEVKSSVDGMKDDISEIKESLSSIATWMELHNKAHDRVPGGWSKAQVFAVIGSVVVATLSLITSSVLGIITVIHITGKP